jgi:hypothetical protein
MRTRSRQPGVVATELSNRITLEETREGVQHLFGQAEVAAGDIAEIITFGLRPYGVTACGGRRLLAGASLPHSRGLPSASPAFGLSDRCGEASCSVSVRVLGWMCMRVRWW